ncbi:MAG: glycosyltransferase family 39 protein [Acidimicrobiia bacterium]
MPGTDRAAAFGVGALLGGRSRHRAGRPARARSPLGAALRDHAGPLGAPLAAGLGNVAFIVGAARLLEPEDFAALAAFVAAYTLLNLPGAGLAAAGAIAPGRLPVLGRKLARWGALAGIAIAAGAGPLAGAVRMPVAMVVALGVAAPAAMVLGLARGAGYGEHRHRDVARSLLVEPAVRLAVGLPVLGAAGAVGAAAVVVAAGYLSLLAALPMSVIPGLAGRAGPRRRWPSGAGSGQQAASGMMSASPGDAGHGWTSLRLRWRSGGRAGGLRAGEDVTDGPGQRDERDGPGQWLGPPEAAPVAAAAAPHARHAKYAGLVFAAFAVLQQQDLLFANRQLDPAAAGSFAIVSTVGGVVAFAAMTLPLVVLPSGGAHRRHRVNVALALAAVGAVTALVIGAVAGPGLVGLVRGEADPLAARLVAPYLAGMGLLAVARVLAAERCAAGRARPTAVAVGAVAVGHAVALALLGRGAARVTAVTLAAMMLLTVVVGLPRLARVPTLRRALDALRHDRSVQRSALILAGLTIAGLGLRLIVVRGLWVDEAISVHQAHLPLAVMLDNLRQTDVHPPLHHLILWATVRAFGDGELVVRLPSIIAGALTVPAVFGLAKELFDRRTAMLAATLAVPAPFMVWYSQEARMYSLFMLVAVLSAWAQVAALRRGTWSAWLLSGICAAALVATQWFGLVPLAVQQVACLVALARARPHRARGRAKGALQADGASASSPGGDGGGAQPQGYTGLKRLAARWAASLAVMVVLLAPLVPFLLDQLAAYQARGAGLQLPSTAGTAASDTGQDPLSVYAALANIIWATVGYHSDQAMAQIAALWPLLLLGALGVLGRKWSPSTKLCVALAVVPLTFLYVLGFFKRDLFELRYAAGIAPLVVILVARSATAVARSRVALGTVAALLVALSFVGLADQQTNGANPRLYDFEGALARAEAGGGPDAVLAYAPAYLGDVIDYYAPDMRAAPLDEFVPDAGTGPVYVLVTDRLVNDKVGAGRVGFELSELEKARPRVERIERPNVTLWELTP